MFSKFWKFQEITSVVQFFLEAGANCFSTEEKLKAAIWKRWGKSTSAIKKKGLHYSTMFYMFYQMQIKWK